MRERYGLDGVPADHRLRRARRERGGGTGRARLRSGRPATADRWRALVWTVWPRSLRSSRSRVRARCVGRSTTPCPRRCARASRSARCSSSLRSPRAAGRRRRPQRRELGRARAPARAAPRGRGGLPADLVELAGWIALEYCSTPARALSLVLPPGAGAGVQGLARLVAELTAAGRAAPARGVRLTALQRAVLEQLRAGGRRRRRRLAPATARCAASRRGDSCG